MATMFRASSNDDVHENDCDGMSNSFTVVKEDDENDENDGNYNIPDSAIKKRPSNPTGGKGLTAEQPMRNNRNVVSETPIKNNWMIEETPVKRMGKTMK